MPNDPYVVITPAGLNQLATYHEINVIVRGVVEIFKTHPDIDLSDDGVMIQIHIVDGNIVCELIADDEPLNSVMVGISELFENNPSIDLTGDGIEVQIYTSEGAVVCQLVEDEEPPEETPTEEVE